eukprot:3855471-Prymnesium_polylepis.1
MPHAAPAIGTGPRRPAIGGRIFDFDAHSTAQVRPRAATTLRKARLFLRFLSDRLPPDHAANRPEHAPTLLFTRCDHSLF